MKTNNTVKVRVYRLGWSGMKKETITVSAYPKEVLKVDDWFSPQIGELCFNDKYEIDVVKNITFQRGTEVFKSVKQYSFEKSKSKMSSDDVIRLEVKKGKVFIFNGKVFVHQESLDGGYIDKISRGDEITEYEYEKYQ